MSHRHLRDELRDVFDSISEPAHPALSARIREHIAAGAAPGIRAPRLAVAMALAMAAILVGGLVFLSRHGVAPPTTPAGQPTISATAVPSSPPAPAVPGVSASPQPGPSGAVPTDNLPPFRCAAQSGGASTALTGVTAARTAAQSGYDRFVLELDGPVPQYDVMPQASATFTQDASGQAVALAGSAGLVVKIHQAQSHGTFTGSTDLKPGGTAVLREARQVGDFEGVVTWGLGLSRASCFRTFTLSGPSRLVVDVQG